MWPPPWPTLSGSNPSGLAEVSIGGGHPLSVILYTRCLVHLMEADLITVRDAAQQALACKLMVPPETEPIRQQVRRFLCTVHYQWNELEKAPANRPAFGR